MDRLIDIIIASDCSLAYFVSINVPKAIITSFYMNDERSIFLKNAGNHLPVYTVI